jgi:Rad3-related DNA helicase
MDMNPRFQQAMSCLDEIKQNGLMGKTLRPAQEKALRLMVFLVYNQNKKYVSLTAPTGSGKSHIAACWAVIVNGVDNHLSNITTSSRALQKQYGEVLKVDDRFKVVMGSTNYRCSLFLEEDGDMKNRRSKISGQWSPASSAPCQDYEKGFDYEYAGIDVAYKRDEKQIMTIHEDQDIAVLGNIKSTLSMLRRGDDITTMGKLKRTCVECKSCSYTVARSAADSAVATIRSFQHLLFYIMYKVSQQQAPILQQREVHILDECHNIDAVFRDFFSTAFNVHTYADAVAKTLDALAKDEPIEVDTNFERFKKSEGRSWLESEKSLLCQHISEELGKVIDKTLVKIENTLRTGTAKPYVKESESSIVSPEVAYFKNSKESLT